MALLLARRDVLEDGETGREDVLEAQELAAGVASGLEAGDPLPGDRVLDDFSPAGYGAPPHVTGNLNSPAQAAGVMRPYERWSEAG